MKAIKDPKRSKRILAAFRAAYAGARHGLNLPPIETRKMRLSSRPTLSGSGGPRSILAYYAAIWHLCASPDSGFAVPIVIDSPNQQAQDQVNLPAVMKFIAASLPGNTQLIVGLEHHPDLPFDREILLSEKYSLLTEEAFKECSSRVTPLMDAMFNSLLKFDSPLLDKSEGVIN